MFEVAPPTATPPLNHWYEVIAGGVFGLAVRVTDVMPLSKQKAREPVTVTVGLFGKGLIVRVTGVAGLTHALTPPTTCVT